MVLGTLVFLYVQPCTVPAWQVNQAFWVWGEASDVFVAMSCWLCPLGCALAPFREANPHGRVSRSPYSHSVSSILF